MPKSSHLDRLSGHNNRLLSFSFILLLQLQKPASCDERTKASGSLLLPQGRLQHQGPQELLVSVTSARKPVFYGAPASMRLEAPKSIQQRTSGLAEYRFRGPVVYRASRGGYTRTRRSLEYLAQESVYHRAPRSSRSVASRGSRLDTPVFRASVQNSSAKIRYPGKHQAIRKSQSQGESMISFPGLLEDRETTINRDGVDLKMPAGAWESLGSFPGIDHGAFERLEQPRGVTSFTGKGLGSEGSKSRDTITMSSAPPWTEAEDSRKSLHKRRKRMTRKAHKSDTFIFKNGIVSDYTKRKKKVKEKPSNETNLTREKIVDVNKLQNDKKTRHHSEEAVMYRVRNINENGRLNDEVSPTNIDSNKSRRSRSLGQEVGHTRLTSGKTDKKMRFNRRLYSLTNNVDLAEEARRFRRMIEHAPPRRVLRKWPTRMKRSSSVKSLRPIQFFRRIDEGRLRRHSSSSSRLLQLLPLAQTDFRSTQQEREGNSTIVATIYKRFQSAIARHKGVQRRQRSSDTSPVEVKVKEGLQARSETPHRPAKRLPQACNNSRRPLPSLPPPQPLQSSPPGREDIHHKGRSQVRERKKVDGGVETNENLRQIIIKARKEQANLRRETEQKKVAITARPTKDEDVKVVAKWKGENLKTVKRNESERRRNFRLSGNRNTTVERYARHVVIPEGRSKKEVKHEQTYSDVKSTAENMIHDAGLPGGKREQSDALREEVDKERRDKRKITVERSVTAWRDETSETTAGHLNQQEGSTPAETGNTISRSKKSPMNTTDRKKPETASTHTLPSSIKSLSVLRDFLYMHFPSDTDNAAHSFTNLGDKLPFSTPERESNLTSHHYLPLILLQMRKANDIFTEICEKKTRSVQTGDGEKDPLTGETEKCLGSLFDLLPFFSVQFIIDGRKCCKGDSEEADKWYITFTASLPLREKGVRIPLKIHVVESSDDGRCVFLTLVGRLDGGLGTKALCCCCRSKGNHKEGDYIYSEPYSGSHRPTVVVPARSRPKKWTPGRRRFIILRGRRTFCPRRPSRRHIRLIIRSHGLTTICAPITARRRAFKQAVRTTVGRILLLMMFLDMTVPDSTSGNLLLGSHRTQGSPTPRIRTQGLVDLRLAGELSDKSRTSVFTTPVQNGPQDLSKNTSDVDLVDPNENTLESDLTQYKPDQETRESEEERKVSKIIHFNGDVKTPTKQILRVVGTQTKNRRKLMRSPLDHEHYTVSASTLLGDVGAKMPTKTQFTALDSNEFPSDPREALKIVRAAFYDLQRGVDIGSNSALGMLRGVGNGRKLDESSRNQRRSKRNVKSRRNTKMTRTREENENKVGIGRNMKSFKKHKRTEDNVGTRRASDASRRDGRYKVTWDANRGGHRRRRRRGVKRPVPSYVKSSGSSGSLETPVTNHSLSAFPTLLRHSHRVNNASKSGNVTTSPRDLQTNNPSSVFTLPSMQEHISIPRRSKPSEGFMLSESHHNITSAGDVTLERRVPEPAPVVGAAGASGGVRCSWCSTQPLPEIFTRKKSFIYSTRPLARESPPPTTPNRPAYFFEDLPQSWEGHDRRGFKDSGENHAFDLEKLSVYDTLLGKVEEGKENKQNPNGNENFDAINANQNSSGTFASGNGIRNLKSSNRYMKYSTDGYMSNTTIMSDIRNCVESATTATDTEAATRKSERSGENDKNNTGTVDIGRPSESSISAGISLLNNSIHDISATHDSSHTSSPGSPVADVFEKWSGKVWDAPVTREKHQHTLKKQNNTENSKAHSPGVNGSQEHLATASVPQYNREPEEHSSGNKGFERKTLGRLNDSPGIDEGVVNGNTRGVFTRSRSPRPDPHEWRNPVWSPVDYRTYRLGSTGRRKSFSELDRYHSASSPGPRLSFGVDRRFSDSFSNFGFPHTRRGTHFAEQSGSKKSLSFSKPQNYRRGLEDQPRLTEITERNNRFYRPSADLSVVPLPGKVHGHLQGRLEIPQQIQPRPRPARQRQVDYHARKGNYSQEKGTVNDEMHFQKLDNLGYLRDQPLSHLQSPISPSNNSHSRFSNHPDKTTRNLQGHRSSQSQASPHQYSPNYSSKFQPVHGLNFTVHHLQEPHHAKRSRNNRNASPSRRNQQQWTRYANLRGGSPSSRERQVPLLGLFDLTIRGEPRLGGRSELAAAQLALTHINDQRIIPGHKLVMFHNDTKCDSGSGVDAFFHAIYTSQAKMMILLGAACPEVTESLAAVVHYWNVVQVSFGSVSPALSDRSSFPRFIRTVAPDSSHNAARLSFLTHHSWTTVATISENHDMYTLALNELMPALEAANISLQATVTLSPGDYTEHLHTLKERDCRIFIASFSADLARKVFCQAYHLGMYGADYAWVLSGSAQDRWWGVTAGTNCSAAQLVEAVQGVVLVAAHAAITGTHASQSGLTNSQFLQEFSRTGQPLTEYVTQTYDAVWAIALALRQLAGEGGGVGVRGGQARSSGHRRHQVQRAAPARREVNSARVAKVTRPPRKPDKEGQECSSGLHQLPGNSTRPTMSWILGRLAKLQQGPGRRQPGPGPDQSWRYGHSHAGLYTPDAATFQLDTFDYSREDMADKILETMQGLRFRGVSGPISFDCPDRVGVTAFYQIQDGVPVKVALYHPEAEALDLGCPGCQDLVWPGGEVPASRVFKLRVDTIAPAAFVIMSSLAILGILLALAFLIFNLTYRRLKYIKLSSPRLNNTTVVGCVLVYTAVILLGLDHATLPAPHCFPVVCTARAYLLSAGFSLAFGSMFTKTYRVHQIFTRSNSAGVVRNKLLKDKQLITLIMVLLAVDVVIVSAWVAVDPMTRHLHNLTLELSSQHRGVVYQPQVEVCRSEHTREWLGALYVYKGLLVAVGVYMAWETRHVKIPALNDSQYIGMSVYNVVITSVIVIVAANIIGERTTLAYVIITTLIFTSTTTTLCLLFIPKILTIWRRAEGDPIVESMGLKIQSNTRRLLTEDKREKYYRAEVQNKVYRREVLKLEQELHKLHRWVEAPDSPTSSSSRSFDPSKKKGSISSMASDNGRVRGEGGVGDFGICSVEGGGVAAEEGLAGGDDDSNGGRVLGEVLVAPHTQYLQSDDTTVRRVKRERMFRSLHRSLPSLTLGCPPRRPSDTRLPADGAENEAEAFGPSQVFFDARRFHEDQEEARRQAEEEEEDCDDDECSPRLGNFPASPHPLQRSRLVKRSPIKPRMEPEDEGIVDLRYTLNFSTPLLHGVTEADLPFSISTHVQHGPRVSFLDQDAYHSYDSSPEIHKSSLSTCSFSSPEVRRPSRNTFSSTDIRLQIECSGVIPDEKLSPLVEYRVNDLEVLCPYGQRSRPHNPEVPPKPTAAGLGGQEVNSASEVRRYASNGAVTRRPPSGPANYNARHGKTSKRNANRPTSDNATISNAARSSGHIFSAVIVHHVANVHM